MGSVNDKGRDRGPKGRRDFNERRRQALPSMESLEHRRLLSGVEMPVWLSTSADVSDVKNGPLANAGPELIKAYQEYQTYTQGGGKNTFGSSPLNTQKSKLVFLGDYVGVSVNTYGNVSQAMTSLQQQGMVVGGVAAQQNIVEGLLPISKLLTVASLRGATSGVVGMNSLAIPIVRSQGSAANQAEQGMLADIGKTQFKVDGTGVVVGVLSDSVNQVAGGVATSISTGDLPSRGVNVLLDGPAGQADEGRAMLEHVYDIAPGAGLAYHNAFSAAGGETVMAAGILRLANEANAKVIVDDIGFRDEAYYQDGISATAITTARDTKGVSYFSAAGNDANAGFESPFRAVTGTVAGVGAGRYMDFDPSAAQALSLPITVNSTGQFVMQYDNPWFVTNGVTSDVDVFLLDANNTVVASATSNNIATNRPQEVIDVTAGTYRLVVRINAGSPDVSRLAFYSFSANVDFSPNLYGNAGGISYPTTFGHPTADAAIGVGAVAWFDSPAFPSGKVPTPSESFSSFGPSVKVFNADGSRKSAVQFQQTPVISGNDGGNVSFAFGNPPGTGVPAGIPANNYNQYNFFGTSDAAPNVGAVAALMYQLSPASTPTDIRNGLISSTIPLNGTPKGTWDVQGGYGLVQANAALSAVDNLRVVATLPGDKLGVTSTPQYLVVRFSRPINVSSLQASDLVFTAYSEPGISVTVGTPLVSAADPDVVFFPLTFNITPGFKANAAYAYTIKANSITSQDGKPLVGFNGSFAIGDNVAPRVTSTSFNGRFVMVKFSEPMNPASFNKSNFYLIRTGSSGVFGSPTNVVVNQDPRITLGYDAATNTAILDFSNVDQSLLPSDHYGLVVLDSVTDATGNRLDGEFSGTFPSGDGKEGTNFTQDLGVLNLGAPQIVSFGLDQGIANVRTTSDTGIPGDQNTNLSQPLFSGQISSAFPGTIAGLQVVAQFNGLRGGTLTLAPGAGGRGFTGYDPANCVSVTTNSAGQFLFQAPAGLPSGFQTVRVIVVGAADQPPLPGLSRVFDSSFRVDQNSPILTPAAGSIQPNDRISALSTVVIDATDPVLPSNPTSPFAVPTQFSVPALDPASATNISNYALINLGSDNAPGGIGTAADFDESSFITSAVYANVGQRTQTTDPFRGQITLSFAPGLPNGRYVLFARQPVAGLVPGITDAAGNPIFATDSTGPVNRDFTLQFDLQPTPIYITSVQAATPSADGKAPNPDTREAEGSGYVLSGPKSYFEIAVPGNTPRATSAPTKFSIDFSNPLGVNPFQTPAPSNPVDFTGKVFLIRSGDTPLSGSDGDFGTDPTFQSGVGYTIVPTTVTAINSVVGAEFGEPGYRNRLLIEIEAGTSLPADHYRLYIPNAIRNNGQDLRIFDTFGNQLDGEFLGNPSPLDNGTYENLLSTGEIRPNDLSGDGMAGGAFETGYIVVPNGNVIFTSAEYRDEALASGDDPDGSLARPYPTLAPEAVPNALNDGRLNDFANFGTGFDPKYDRNGNGHFDRSAFVAAAGLSVNGPVVIVALPSTLLPSQTFVLQAPAGTDPVVNDGSATVPFNTSLVFQPGTVLKFRNASLFVQNQGSSIQVRGGRNPQDQVTFTSYADDSVGGDTNRDGASSSPIGGDWGGIVLRNFDDSSSFPGFPNGRPIPEAPGPEDVLRARLGVSGADEALSFINQATIRYAGGAVPQTIGFRYDAITNFNARPSLSNLTISQTGGGNSAQAPISGDVDSFREDDLARGLLVRRTNVFANSINGIYVRANLNGVASPTDSVSHPDNPSSLGGAQNYSFFAPLPYVLVSRLEVGRVLRQDTNGQTRTTSDRFYFQPGTVMKFQRGAAIDVVTAAASINIGDRTYIKQFDANNNFGPDTAGFKPADFGDAQVLFTSFFDDNATTSYRNPNSGALTTVVAPLDSDNGGKVNLPTPTSVPVLARWGGISVPSGSITVIDEATMQFGGGSVNTASGTRGQRDVLDLRGAGTNAQANLFLGTKAYITNNNFYDNLQAPISIDPNGLLATDPLHPLVSGNPFFRGNIMLRNDVNALEVLPEINNNGDNGALNGITGTTTYVGYDPNQFVTTVWDDTDVTYFLRSTIRLAGSEFLNRNTTGASLPPAPTGTNFLPELKPSVVLTIQSSLPDSPLANGQKIPRPGESALVKLLNTQTVTGDGIGGVPTSTIGSNDMGGAGFMAGVDNGVDPPADSLIDPGYLSQIRITGIGGNETTGQQRVPVIITSLRDDSVGRTVRGVDMFVTRSGNTTAPAAGDAGLIVFGALGLSDYNLLDPRDGSIIDNADIRYMTRIEQQGGGWVYDDTDSGGPADRRGTTPYTQYNTAKAMTVSNSNFSDFSQVGFIAHSSEVQHLVAGPDGSIARFTGPIVGQPTLTFFVNNTYANMPAGVRINSEISADTFVDQASPAEAVFLNNTFYNTGEAIHLEGSVANGNNPMAHVYALIMNNIFANSTDAAIRASGQTYGSQGQYNLFSSNATNVSLLNGSGYTENQPINGNAAFQDPTRGLFNLLPTSDAIDSSRSEIGPILLGTSLQPIVNQQLDATGGIRRPTGRTNTRGGLGGQPASGDIVSLPGYTLRDFKDQWVPALTGTAGAIPGPNTNAGGTYSYTPIAGERDQAGYLRQDIPSKANVGFGSRPFFDTGASEYRLLNPPNITGVTAVITTAVTPATPDGKATIPFYTAGSVIGANQTPRQIIFKFDERLDPTTVNNKTIILQAAGGDAIFDNGNDRFIDLSGKLFYDAVAQTVTLALADSNLALGNDVYRLEVFGSGGNVIRDPEGLPLDGENTVGGRPEGATLPLPTGDGFPGGNFFLTFTIDTNAPVVAKGSFALAGASDSGARDNITNTNRPSFQGTVFDIAPPTNPLANQTVFVDVSTLGNGVYDRLGVARGTTDALGNFIATYVDPTGLFESPYNVGPDGNLGTADDTGFSVARLRIVDQSGNVSNLSDPNGLIRIFIDTKGPKVVATQPTSGSVVSSNAGAIPVTILVNENLDRTTINASSIKVTRSVNGVFGDGDDQVVSADVTNIQLVNALPGQSNPMGAQYLQFNITGATASDLYRVTLTGTGTTPLTDIAGNAVDGNNDNVAGGDFTLDFLVFNPGASRLIYVNANVATSGNGSRALPYKTINEGIASATAGDTVAVLPGTYSETINLKSLIKVVSAATTSTATTRVPGNALKTIIVAPGTGGTATSTVTANKLLSVPAFATEFSGFTVAAPLVGDPSRGPINGGSIALSIYNSDLIVSKNYFVDAGVGAQVVVDGLAGTAPTLYDNGFIGNLTGVTVLDTGVSRFANGHNVTLANNTFAYNTIGLYENSATPGNIVQLADVVNNIFYQNADRSGSRNGAAILTNGPNRMSVHYNLFSGNGPLDAAPVDDLINVGSGVNALTLNAVPDAFGNFTGNPAFVSPIDPRPDGNGPANFYLGASYDLQLSSAAIDMALNSSAPTVDFLSRGRVDIANKGRAGFGPADVGAFEYGGTVGTVVSNSTTSGGNSGTISTRSVSSGGVTARSTVPNPSKVGAGKAGAGAKAKAKAAAANKAVRKHVAVKANTPTGPISLVNRFNNKKN